MKIAIINDGKINTIDYLRNLFPNVSFPAAGVGQDFLNENSLMEVVVWETFDYASEKLETVEPYIKDGKVYTCLKVAKTEVELQEDMLRARLAQENSIREQRNQFLKDSDWTQVADAPVDKTSWATYRQVLRDLTSQEGFPFNVVFPNPPL